MYKTPDVQFKFFILLYSSYNTYNMYITNNNNNKKPKAFTADGNPNFTFQFEYTNKWNIKPGAVLMSVIRILKFRRKSKAILFLD